MTLFTFKFEILFNLLICIEIDDLFMRNKYILSYYNCLSYSFKPVRRCVAAFLKELSILMH